MIAKTLDGLSVLQSELLLAAGVPHGWFDKSLGNTIFRPSNPFKDPEWVDEHTMRQRYNRACRTIGLDGSKIVITSGLLQTNIIKNIDTSNANKTVGPADGYITNKPALPILLSAADCAQIIIYDPLVNAIAVVHTGGLGTARGTTIKAIQRLVADFKARPRTMIAAIGPTIGAKHFVPTNKTDEFALEDIASTRPVIKRLPNGRAGYDIVATNIRQLRELGIPATQIEASSIDTYEQTNWYSYERDRTNDVPASMRRHGLFVALPTRIS